MTRFRLTIIAVEKLVLHILSACLHCCLSIPACKAHWPYCIVVCGLHGCTLSHKVTNFGRRLL